MSSPEEESSSSFESNFESTSSIDLIEASNSNGSSIPSSFDSNSLDSKKIKNLLLSQQQKFKIIKNESSSGAASGFPIIFKSGRDENSAESLRIFAESVSNVFPGETEQRILNSSTFGGILFIKIVFIRLSVGKMPNSV